MIDVEGIKSLLKDDCVTCDVRTKIKQNTRCNDCPFRLSADNRCETRTDFKRYGVDRLYKHQLYYFLYHPELNFKFPPLPYNDLMGIPKSDHTRWIWEIHHHNENKMDDTNSNLEMLINTEHSRIHFETDNPMRNDEFKQKRMDTVRSQINNNEHWLQSDKNPMKNKDVIAKHTKARKETIAKQAESGTLPLPKKMTGIYDKFMALDINDQFCIDKKCAIELSYANASKLRESVEGLFARRPPLTNSFTMTDNGKGGSYKRYYITRIK